MLIGAAAGASGGTIVGAIADMLWRPRGLHPATLPVLALGLFSWIAKPKGDSP